LESSGNTRYFFDSTLIASLIAFIGMTAAYVYSVALWILLSATIVSWVATDVIFSLFVAGGSGIFIFKPFSTETLFKGRAYLLFLGMIVFSTVISSWLIDRYLDTLLKSQDMFTILVVTIPKSILATNFFTILLAFVDFNTRFYQRQKQSQ
jgi:hypothetical protein